jgi:hypothetical protein
MDVESECHGRTRGIEDMSTNYVAEAPGRTLRSVIERLTMDERKPG